jgi:uncharacterized protein (DUF362 family)/Pyruvate/2-oxoacid:ferredoxin oxidoreductase delta subunit
VKSKISIVKCGSYDYSAVEKAVREAVDLLGGISNFVKPGSKVLVKPNLLMAKGPEYAIDTNPEVVRAVIRLLKEVNAKIYVGDGASVWPGQSKEMNVVYERSGIKKVTEEEGVNLVKFDNRRWYGTVLLTTWLSECDYVISVPKFKTHNYTVLTGAIKNLFGLVPDSYKLELHKRHPSPYKFARMLVDIYETVRPSLSIIDGIVAMEGDGPGTSGTLRKLGLVLAGSDAVALDSVMARIMGIKPLDVPMIKEAHSRKLGNADREDIDIAGEALKDIAGPPFKSPNTFNMGVPEVLQKVLFHSVVRFYPEFDREKCVLCKTCIKTCPNSAIKVYNDRLLIDYSKCLSCFCCQESCPHGAIKVKRGLLAKLMRYFVKWKSEL